MALSYDAGTNTATFTFPGYPGGFLPAGDYTAKIYGTLTDLFGNPMGVETPFQFTLAPPVVDLNGGAAGLDYTNLWSTATGPVTIADPANATVTDPSTSNLTQMTVALPSPHTGDVLAAAVTGAITATFAGNTLTLSGSDTAANYQQVLRTVTYNNTAVGGPMVASITAKVVVTDASGLSSPDPVATINIDAAAPVVTTSTPQTWTVPSGPAVAIDPAGTITDADSTTLTKLTATIVSPAAGDVLHATAANNITITNNDTTAITLTGSDTLANYQSVLQGITYNNTAGGPGVGSETVNLVATDEGALNSATAGQVVNIQNVVAIPSTVASRLLFYNQSAFDGGTAGVSPLDDSAISNKVAYLPGGAAPTNAATSFVFESNYAKGINGVMLDLSAGGSIAGTHGSITASDFVFRIGVDNGSGITFADATVGQLPTTVSTRTGAGAAGSDRVELIWANNVLRNVWLEVQVKAEPTGNTGLAQNVNYPAGIGDIFYFANKAGDTANDNSGAYVSSPSDQTRIHINVAIGVGVNNTFDVNKDGNVSSADQLIVHLNPGLLHWYSTGVSGPFAPDAGPSAPSAAPASLSITDMASGLTSLLNNLGSGVPSWLQSRLVNILDSAPAVKIFHTLESHNTAVDRLLLMGIDALADKFNLHDDVLDGILADMGLE
jgi:hypothetical protein